MVVVVAFSLCDRGLRNCRDVKMYFFNLKVKSKKMWREIFFCILWIKLGPPSTERVRVMTGVRGSVRSVT